MKFSLFPFIILMTAILGIVLNPKNNLILRITIVCASVMLFVVSNTTGEISEILILIFAMLSVFIIGFYYSLVSNERM